MNENDLGSLTPEMCSRSGSRNYINIRYCTEQGEGGQYVALEE